MRKYTRFFLIFLLYAMSGNVFADIRKNTGTIDPDYINLSAQEFLSLSLTFLNNAPFSSWSP